MPRKTESKSSRRTRCRSSFNEAAAECRGKRGPVCGPDYILNASMRPRLSAAENARYRAFPGYRWRSFNEAAAECRGKPPIRSGRRPRTFRFNEAAAECRGKRRSLASYVGSMCTCFNEAAAECRGKRRNIRGDLGLSAASMRPRLSAAENAYSAGPTAPGRSCFNEAAAECRGKPRGDNPQTSALLKLQ